MRLHFCKTVGLNRSLVYINNHDLQFLNNVYINKTKVLLSQTYVTLFMPFEFYCSIALIYLAFQSFHFERYLVKVIPETRYAH
jgi:hypothetical protein